MKKVYQIFKLNASETEVPDGYYYTTPLKTFILYQKSYPRDYPTLEEAEEDLKDLSDFGKKYVILPIYSKE